MHRDGRRTAIRMPEVLVRPALPNFGEAVSFEQCDHLARLEDRDGPHLRNLNLADLEELRLQLRFAILEQHLDHLP